MYGNYRNNYKRNEYSSNVVPASDRIDQLKRAIKLLREDVKTIVSMLEDIHDLPRNKPKREYTLPLRSDYKKQNKVLQTSSSEDEGTRIHESKRQSRSRMVDLHEQRQNVDGKVIRDNIAFDTRPPTPLQFDTNRIGEDTNQIQK